MSDLVNDIVNNIMAYNNRKLFNYVNIDEEKEIKLFDEKYLFSIIYVPSLNEYFLSIAVFWVATYERYYRITEEDYELYMSDKSAFYEKYKTELRQNSNDCFTENFAGASGLRDYDGSNGFQRAFSPPRGAVNPFQHYAYIDGVLYARILLKDRVVLVPPVQAIPAEDGKYKFPLREKCELVECDGRPICYALKLD